MSLEKEAKDLHRKLKGKIELKPKIPVTQSNLRLIYTPGVAHIVREISKNKENAYEYTGKGNTIAIVCDGSRILGLGNKGAEAALPVMEGKAMLFKAYGDVNAVPLCIRTQDKEEIISFIKNISPTFGAINLEDVSSPNCLEIVDRLKNLEIPVFHDDQHGTAIAALAGLLNSLKILKKEIKKVKIVIAGAGTAGYGIANLLHYAGAKNILITDSKGIIYEGRPHLNHYKEKLASFTNPNHMTGDLSDALIKADVFIGVSGEKNLLNKKMIESMNTNPIVFALSNPDPEILPDEAKSAGAAIIATGRSDFDNPINNVLVFPFLMRKILKERIKVLDESLFYKTALKIASVVRNPNPNRIIPSLEEMKKVNL
ncbi:NADP-dependent malic enzyme [Candidatus Pacearchaeota archaeon]|nr:NADP-dependent malic enzyme [Candidatus Pacearchaeota archaeon]